MTEAKHQQVFKSLLHKRISRNELPVFEKRSEIHDTAPRNIKGKSEIGHSLLDFL